MIKAREIYGVREKHAKNKSRCAPRSWYQNQFSEINRPTMLENAIQDELNNDLLIGN